MPFTRASFAAAVEDIARLSVANLREVGFCVEMLLGFDADGAPLVTAVHRGAAWSVNQQDPLPGSLRVLRRPLTQESTLLAATLAVHGVQAAIYSGPAYLPSVELEGVITVGAWPAMVYADSFFAEDASLDEPWRGRAHLVYPQTASEDLVVWEQWLVALVPDA